MTDVSEDIYLSAVRADSNSEQHSELNAMSAKLIVTHWIA